MFSWSTNRRRQTSDGFATATTATTTTTSNPVSIYPAHRGHSSSITAPAIQGTIRPPSSSSSAAFSRQEHLDSFLRDDTLQRSTRPVSNDDSTYDTVFQTVSGDTLILRVNLPLASGKPPTMVLAGVKAVHDWLDSTTMSVIGYSPIRSETAWNQSRTLLGKAVRQVVEHLQLHPPRIIQFTDAALAGIQRNPTSAASNGYSATRQQQSAAGVPRSIDVAATSTNGGSSSDAPPDYETLLSVPELDMPPIPSSFEELDNLTREELDKLLDDEEEFNKFCSSLSIMKTYSSIALSVIDDNAKQAKKNLAKEATLIELHDKVEALQKQLAENIASFQELEKRQDAIAAPPKKKDIVRKLNKAKKEAFDESEALADDWMDGNYQASVDDFVKAFLEKRILHHERAAKLELVQRMDSAAMSHR